MSEGFIEEGDFVQFHDTIKQGAAQATYAGIPPDNRLVTPITSSRSFIPEI